jgi:cytosine/creatinine deaminase
VIPDCVVGEGGAVEVLRSVSLAERAGSFDIRLEGGRIAAIAPASAGATSPWLALPAFANLHAHADRAFAAPARRPGSLSDAVQASKSQRAAASADDIRTRARRLFERSVAHGAALIRTHTDVDAGLGMRAIEGVLAAAADMAPAIGVEVVAFAHAGAEVASAQTRDLLTEAVRLGARLVGAVPALHERPARSLDAVLELAARLGVSVDLHLDEHLDAAASLLGRLADATLDLGLQGRVAVSHGCALSVLEPSAAVRILDRMARARMLLVVLPALNLYLQDRGGASPRRRGLPPLCEAFEAGVEVRFGTDNVRDWFFPYGDGDPLEAGFLGALAAHVDAPERLIAAMCGGRDALRAGEAADIALVPAESFDDALARRPPGRVLVRGGRVAVQESDPETGPG